MNYNNTNQSNALEPVETGRDLSRQSETIDDFISIQEVQEIFRQHGRSVTERTLQRYCAKYQLDGQKRITGEGEKWFVRKNSIFTRLNELDEFDRLRRSRQVATGNDLSAFVAEQNKENFPEDEPRQRATKDLSMPVVPAQSSHTTTDDLSRPAAADRDKSDEGETAQQQIILDTLVRERHMYELILEQYRERVGDLAKDKHALQADKEMLVEQLRSKDKQIDKFFSSERDTKTLFGSLQSLMNALWPKGQKADGNDRYVPMRDALDSGLDQHLNE